MHLPSFSEAGAPPPIQSYTQQAPSLPPAGGASPPTGRSAWVWAGVGVLALAAVAGAIYAVTRPKKRKNRGRYSYELDVKPRRRKNPTRAEARGYSYVVETTDGIAPMLRNPHRKKRRK